MKITKFAQSTIRVENSQGRSLLFDPGSYNIGPGMLEMPEALFCDVLVVTHKHADHFDPTVLERVSGPVGKPPAICGSDLAPKLADLGFPTRVVSAGDTVNEAGFRIIVTKAVHVVRGEDVPVFGIIIEADGKRIYHASDTQFRTPDELGVNSPIDVAFLPFCGREVVMTEEECVEFTRILRPGLVVPVHYDSPKDSHLVPEDFATQIRAVGFDSSVLGFGESIIL